MNNQRILFSCQKQGLHLARNCIQFVQGWIWHIYMDIRDSMWTKYVRIWHFVLQFEYYYFPSESTEYASRPWRLSLGLTTSNTSDPPKSRAAVIPLNRNRFCQATQVVWINNILCWASVSDTEMARVLFIQRFQSRAPAAWIAYEAKQAINN